MPTIDELKPEQLKDPEIFEKIEELADEFILHSQAKEAYFLQQKLTPILEAANIKSLAPDLDKQYQNLIAQLKWVAMPMLPDDEVLKLLRENYLTVLENEDINVIDRIEAKMFSKELFPRDEFRQKMRKALEENKEQLGKNRTLGEWILDFNKTFDFRNRDELSSSMYLNQSPEARALPEPEKNKLRKAFRIFDDTLLVTPVMGEPEFSMSIMAMIKGGIIDKTTIDPALFQAISITAKIPMRPIVIPRTVPKEIISPKLASLPRQEMGPEPKKPSFFKQLFGKPDKKSIKIPPQMPEIKLEKSMIPPMPKKETYEDKISPYEIEREMPQIPTFPKTIEKIEKEITKEEPEKPKIETKYEIRTMKDDIETAKRQPIPPKPAPKIHDNIVDLSGK